MCARSAAKGLTGIDRQALSHTSHPPSGPQASLRALFLSSRDRTESDPKGHFVDNRYTFERPLVQSKRPKLRSLEEVFSHQATKARLVRSSLRNPPFNSLRLHSALPEKPLEARRNPTGKTKENTHDHHLHRRLRLRERIANRADLKLISLPADERRSPDARLEAMKAADVTVLCLPDDAAREAVKLADEAGTRVLDASSAHRTAPEWVYGMPELMNGRAAEIARASRVSVPGCHASGFILLVAPLVSAGIIAPDAFLSATSVTGYSGGGKKMISAYETAGRTAFDSLAMPLPYAHSQTHKHLPEMTIAAGLARPPVFQPIVGSFRCGMLVTVPLDLGLLGTTKETVQSVWATHYAGSPVVRPVEFESLLEDGALRLDAMAGHDGMKIAVSGGPHRVLLTALYDNLGKGSSGAALECLNLMTDSNPARGLSLS